MYVEGVLLASKSVAKAAIVGLDGLIWGYAPDDFKLSEREIKALVMGYKDPSSIRASGLILSGVRYMTLRTDETLITGMRVHLQ